MSFRVSFGTLGFTRRRLERRVRLSLSSLDIYLVLHPKRCDPFLHVWGLVFSWSIVFCCFGGVELTALEPGAVGRSQIHEELHSTGGDNAEAQARRILFGLGFDDNMQVKEGEVAGSGE